MKLGRNVVLVAALAAACAAPQASTLQDGTVRKTVQAVERKPAAFPMRKHGVKAGLEQPKLHYLTE